jgi:outer membrane receptor protein involved in Fe transport
LALRTGLRWHGTDLSLYGQNVLDQHAVLFENRDFAAPYVQIYWQRAAQPRTIGLTATYRF